MASLHLALFSWYFLLFFHLQPVSFFPHFDCLFVFVSMYHIDLLWLTVFMGWPYVVGVLWGPVVQSPDHLSWVLQECPLCGLCGPFCYNWVLIAIGSFIHWIDPQAGWLWEWIPIMACELLLYRCWPREAKFASVGLGVCPDVPLDILLVKIIGFCSIFVWSWPWSIWVLGLLEGTLVETSVRCCLWLALGNLFGVTRITEHLRKTFNRGDRPSKVLS